MAQSQPAFDLDTSKYKFGATLGSGSHGVVISAFDKMENRTVAIKQVPHLFENLRLTKRVLREIRLLYSLRGHQNILSLLDIDLSGDSLYIITEVCQTDLKKLIQIASKKNKHLAKADYLSIVYQTLSALEFVHAAGVIHRDIKPANILIDSEYKVKLCDFGLARLVNKPLLDGVYGDEMTEYVVTRWYRAPEIVVTPGKYGKPQDIWGAACTFAEMYSFSPLFPGTSVIDQLHVIVDVLGKPSVEDMDYVMSDRSRKYLEEMSSREIGLYTSIPGIENIHSSLYDLFMDMLQFNPTKRITAANACNHPVFFEHLNNVNINKQLKNSIQSTNNIHNNNTNNKDLPSIRSLSSELPPDDIDLRHIDRCKETVECFESLIYSEVYELKKLNYLKRTHRRKASPTSPLEISQVMPGSPPHSYEMDPPLMHPSMASTPPKIGDTNGELVERGDGEGMREDGRLVQSPRKGLRENVLQSSISSTVTARAVYSSRASGSMGSEVSPNGVDDTTPVINAQVKSFAHTQNLNASSSFRSVDTSGSDGTARAAAKAVVVATVAAVKEDNVTFVNKQINNENNDNNNNLRNKSTDLKYNKTEVQLHTNSEHSTSYQGTNDSSNKSDKFARTVSKTIKDTSAGNEEFAAIMTQTTPAPAPATPQGHVHGQGQGRRVQVSSFAGRVPAGQGSSKLAQLPSHAGVTRLSEGGGGGGGGGGDGSSKNVAAAGKGRLFEVAGTPDKKEDPPSLSKPVEKEMKLSINTSSSAAIGFATGDAPLASPDKASPDKALFEKPARSRSTRIASDTISAISQAASQALSAIRASSIAAALSPKAAFTTTTTNSTKDHQGNIQVEKGGDNQLFFVRNRKRVDTPHHGLRGGGGMGEIKQKPVRRSSHDLVSLPATTLGKTSPSGGDHIEMNVDSSSSSKRPASGKSSGMEPVRVTPREHKKAIRRHSENSSLPLPANIFQDSHGYGVRTSTSTGMMTASSPHHGNGSQSDLVQLPMISAAATAQAGHEMGFTPRNKLRAKRRHSHNSEATVVPIDEMETLPVAHHHQGSSEVTDDSAYESIYEQGNRILTPRSRLKANRRHTTSSLEPNTKTQIMTYFYKSRGSSLSQQQLHDPRFNYDIQEEEDGEGEEEDNHRKSSNPFSQNYRKEVEEEGDAGEEEEGEEAEDGQHDDYYRTIASDYNLAKASHYALASEAKGSGNGSGSTPSYMNEDMYASNIAQQKKSSSGSVIGRRTYLPTIDRNGSANQPRNSYTSR